MLEAVITEEIVTVRGEGIIIEVQTSWWEPRPLDHSAATVNSAPDSFTCFVCGDQHVLRKKTKDGEVLVGLAKFGGRTAEHWICSSCYPWVDERYVETIEKFDNRRRKRHMGFPKPEPESDHIHHHKPGDGCEVDGVLLVIPRPGRMAAAKELLRREEASLGQNQ